MQIFTDVFLQTLRDYAWNVEMTKDVKVFCAWHFKRRRIAVMAYQAGKTIRLEFVYLSKYGMNHRSARMFEIYKKNGGKELIWQYPNKIILCCNIRGKHGGVRIKPSELDELAFAFAQHFFELIVAYEVCARQVNYDTRKQESYKRVLPSRQVGMIFNNTLVS